MKNFFLIGTQSNLSTKKRIFVSLCSPILICLSNFLLYLIIYKFLYIGNLATAILSWLITYSFAFVFYEVYLLKSKTILFKPFSKEILSFILVCFLPGILECVFMYFMVDVYSYNNALMILLSSLVVAIITELIFFI